MIFIAFAVTLLWYKRNITDFVGNGYFIYFKVKLGDQHKSSIPHVVCKSCEEAIRHWIKGTSEALSLGVPMV